MFAPISKHMHLCQWQGYPNLEDTQKHVKNLFGTRCDCNHTLTTLLVGFSSPNTTPKPHANISTTTPQHYLKTQTKAPSKDTPYIENQHTSQISTSLYGMQPKHEYTQQCLYPPHHFLHSMPLHIHPVLPSKLPKGPNHQDEQITEGVDYQKASISNQSLHSYQKARFTSYSTSFQSIPIIFINTITNHNKTPTK